MMRPTRVYSSWLSMFFVAFGCTPSAPSTSDFGNKDTMSATQAQEWVRQNPATSVLILTARPLSGGPSADDHWFEAQAVASEEFYRGRGASVVRGQVGAWSELDAAFAAARSAGGQATYDRIIFIGHGGYHGPFSNHHDITFTMDSGAYLAQSGYQPAAYSSEVWLHTRNIYETFLCTSGADCSNPDSFPRTVASEYSGTGIVEAIVRDFSLVKGSSSDTTTEYYNDAMGTALLDVTFEREDRARLQGFAQQMGANLATNGLIYFAHCNSASGTGATPFEASGMAESFAQLTANLANRYVAGSVESHNSRELRTRLETFESSGESDRFLRLFTPASRQGEAACTPLSAPCSWEDAEDQCCDNAWCNPATEICQAL